MVNDIIGPRQDGIQWNLIIYPTLSKDIDGALVIIIGDGDDSEV